MWFPKGFQETPVQNFICMCFFQQTLKSTIAQLVKNLQCRRCRFDSWGGKIPWRRDRLPNSSYSGLENSMDCILHGVAKSWTRLSDFHFHLHVCPFSPSLPCWCSSGLCLHCSSSLRACTPSWHFFLRLWQSALPLTSLQRVPSTASAHWTPPLTCWIDRFKPELILFTPRPPSSLVVSLLVDGTANQEGWATNLDVSLSPPFSTCLQPIPESHLFLYQSVSHIFLLLFPGYCPAHWSPGHISPE